LNITNCQAIGCRIQWIPAIYRPRMTLQKSNAWKDSSAAGAALALLAAFGFSLKAIFVKTFVKYTKIASPTHD